MYPTVFIDQMDEQVLLAKKGNPVALATVCVMRMLKAKKDEKKRYQYAKELLKLMKNAGYSTEAAIGLMQFIEGMTALSAAKLKNALKNDMEQEIMEMLGEMKDMKTVQTPILRNILRKKAQEIFRAEGVVEGEAARKLKDARRMLSRGIEINVIADVTELSEEEIRNLQN
jgi:predicted transposase/invertase (TIGR01784 family)